jgi:glycogen operon protein
VLELRARQQRNILTTLLLSQGVPMILGGDEIGRTQRGNNNAYCQDNEISWFDWESADQDLLDFTRYLVELRAQHAVFRRRRWFQDRPHYGEEARDIIWFRPGGERMTDEDWDTGFASSLAVFLNGETLGEDDRGSPVTDHNFFLVFHANDNTLEFTLPPDECGDSWARVVDTTSAEQSVDEPMKPGAQVEAAPYSMMVFRTD